MTSAQFVSSAARLLPVPFLPEVSLYQADDIYALWEDTERQAGEAELAPPFWAVAWPGGVALARYLLDHPSLVAGRTVFDIGSGSGLVAIAATMAGAATAIASEPDLLAQAAIKLNAAANGVPPPSHDTGTGIGTAQVVVAGDVWYEKDLADRVGACLEQAAAAGAAVLTGDIGRRYFPRGRFRCIVSYEIPTTIALEGTQVIRASVWEPAAAPAG